jgi:hypothetical protein
MMDVEKKGFNTGCNVDWRDAVLMRFIELYYMSFRNLCGIEEDGSAGALVNAYQIELFTVNGIEKSIRYKGCCLTAVSCRLQQLPSLH